MVNCISPFFTYLLVLAVIGNITVVCLSVNSSDSSCSGFESCLGVSKEVIRRLTGNNYSITDGELSKTVWSGGVDVLNDVVSMPARGRSLVLHFDPDLPQEIQHKIMALNAVRDTSHTTMSLGVKQSSWPPVTTLLHIVIFLTHKSELMQMLWRDWKPTNLLLLSLTPGLDASILNDDVFNRVEKLVLITAGKMGAHVYTYMPFSSPKPIFVGYWKTPTFKTWDSLFINRFPVFEGYTFHLASWLIQPLLLAPKSPTDRTPVGIIMYMINTLSDYYDFKYTMIFEPPDRKYGTIENGTWVGLLRLLETGEKNFSITCLFQNLVRMTHFSATPLWIEDGWTACLRIPQPLPPWMNLYRSFSFTVWACFFGSLVIVAMFTQVQNYLRKNNTGTSWHHVLSSMLGQSLPLIPKDAGKRIFLAMWILCCFIMSSSYTCNLVSILTVPTYPPRLFTLGQLADSHYRVGVPTQGGSIEDALKSPGSVLMAKLSSKRDHFSHESKSLTAMWEGTHAYIDMDSTLAATAPNSYNLRQKFYPGRCSWYFPKNTPWQYKFDNAITRLVEGGIIEHWYKVVLREIGERDAIRDSSLVPISLVHMEGSFYIIGIGWISAFLALAFEFFWYWKYSAPLFRTSWPTGQRRMNELYDLRH